MRLQPRLNSDQARRLGVQLTAGKPAPFPIWVGETVLALWVKTCDNNHDTWIGTYAWPDGMASMIPVPPEGRTLQDQLAEMYEAMRSETERQVLLQFPPAGQA